jgi:dephospho-CoA kinase
VKPNVALAGSMFAGKSTIADALTDYGYHRMSFAAPLKNVAALAYGTIDKSAMYDTTDRDGAASVKTGRQILQGVGQTIKDVDRDFWLRCFDLEAERYGDTPLVVDDMRFMFEMSWLTVDGWMIVGIDTPSAVRMDRAERIQGRRPSEAELTHESEIEVPRIIQAAHLVVDGTDDPYDNAAKILKWWGIR